MADRVDFDGVNSLIVVKSGVTELDVQVNLYSDWKEWVSEPSPNVNSKFLEAFRTIGGDPVTAENLAGDTYFLTNGWRIRPQESNHRLKINGKIEGFTQEYINPELELFLREKVERPAYKLLCEMQRAQDVIR